MDKRKMLASKLRQQPPQRPNVVIGLDGFVDEIIHVVDKRLDAQTFVRLDNIADFARRIDRASGLSTNIELYPTQRKIGGNGPIMCNALAQHEGNYTYIGSLGMPAIDGVFQELAAKAELITLAASGHTDALEFDDGKILFGKTASLNDITYERLIEVVGKDRFVGLLQTADLFATVNWSLIPKMTEIWRNLIANIIPLLKPRPVRPVMFIDLADPEKRTPKEIAEALSLLKEFRSYFFVVLGFNKKEAYDVGHVLQLFPADELARYEVTLEELNQALIRKLALDAIVIHPVDRSCCVVDGKFFHELGPFVKKPKLTTGAGDNFNAGFVLGLFLGLTPDEALLVGMATSGFYVRNARSPLRQELIAFLDDWADGNV